MICFPQLKSGAICQYPVQVRRKFRTVHEETMDGSQILWSDPDHRFVEWECEFSGLDADEWNALQAFHHTVEGRLQTFIFPDPMDNLFRWSEDLSHVVWQKDPYLLVSGGAADPLGGNSGSVLQNTNVIPQRIVQSVSIPGNYTATISAWVKGVSAAFMKAAGGEYFHPIPDYADWIRVSATFDAGSSVANSEYGFEIPAGTSIQVFGIQLDAQITASPYKKTNHQSGIYSTARFLDDRLNAVAQNPGSFGCVVSIQAKPGA